MSGRDGGYWNVKNNRQTSDKLGEEGPIVS